MLPGQGVLDPGIRYNTAVGVVPGITRTQAGATPLTNQVARVDLSTAPAAGSLLGDGLALPLANAGSVQIVINNSMNPIQVYPANGTTDTINAQSGGVVQIPNSVCVYFAAAPGTWQTLGVAFGFLGNFETCSSLDGMTAHAGGGQGSATPITAMISRFTTVATAADSSVLPVTTNVLPSSGAGISLLVANAAAANSMNVFPASGEQINALGNNTAFALAAGKNATFFATKPGQWHAILSA
jgi:hypothetical protein